MRNISQLAVAAIICAASAGTAMAQCATVPTPDFCLNGLYNSNSLDGIYVSPYTATINGVQTYVICDDFYNDVDLDESWTVQANSVTSAPTSGLFGTASPDSANHNAAVSQGVNVTTGYEEVAWLSQQLIGSLSTMSSYDQDLYSYAIWAVFDPNGVQAWLDSYGNSAFWTAVSGEVQTASTHTSGNFSNVTVYTPVGNETPNCCGVAQEFIAVGPMSAAEAPAAATLAIDFLGLGVLLFVFRRQRFAAR
jgi:hypothetical protein